MMARYPEHSDTPITHPRRLKRGDHVLVHMAVGKNGPKRNKKHSKKGLVGMMPFWHHFIVISNDAEREEIEVIERVQEGIIRQVYSWDEFEEFTEPKRRDFDNAVFSRSEVIRRAESRVGEVGYDLVTNNCEHFATWCKTGHHESAQVKAWNPCAIM